MSKKTIAIFLVSVLVVITAIAIFRSENEVKVDYIYNKGKIYGTFYTATYLQPDGIDLQEKLEERMREFEMSLSTFKPGSVISLINQNNDSVVTDSYFENMFAVAQSVSEKTNGAFDITVAPLVNAWGFGFGDNDRSKTPDVSAILPYVGYKKVQLVNHKLLKSDERTMLDASAIAKGYSSDVMAELLETNGCSHYMVEIGGEIVTKGLNPHGKKWRIGIDKPVDDPANESSELQTIIELSNVSLATSGNYRQFYFQDGRKYAHTIDPRSGFPVNHNLLSATVIAPTCMQADAYATAFMVLGVDSSLQICKTISGMDCYLIYSDEKGQNQVVYTDGFKKYLTE
jgi:thiamine biosynthesis lipoprotein